MKVNIVWCDLRGDKIVDRLARLLSQLTGWPLNDRPIPGVDLNYDMLYIDLAQRFSDWRKAPWAAYFSHYETGTPYKEYWWKLAEPLTVAQTVTADQYGAIVPNPVKIVPPVDERFEIRDRKKPNERFTFGVSGFVTPGGRKGEAMLARLAGDLEGKADFVASGAGWPVKLVNRTLDGLPAFYSRLDCYIVTSTIEGIPMPPLEALACGVPVVIPRGVGMLDELADIPGVWRYEAGDYDDLKKTTAAAIKADKPDREKLRAAVAGYNAQEFARSHVDGLKAVLESLDIVTGTAKKRKKARIDSDFSTDRHGQRGVYYVAYGGPARDCAKAAITTFKQHFPSIPVALCSNEPLGVEDVFVAHDDEDIGGRAAKVMIYDLAPADWQYIAYLDADTEIIAAEEFLWRVIEDGWDMTICKNPDRFHIATQMVRSDNADECEDTFRHTGTDQLIQLNGGVFAFQRNERTKKFFRAWEREWRKYGKRDQAALLRALFDNPLKLYVLGNEWNNITRYPGTIPAWLNHYPMTARRWRGVVHHRLDDPEAWRAVEEFEANR